ncbi:MAG: hypothetical protein ACXVH1_28535 [Solirubrobacteraceae bacterium]
MTTTRRITTTAAAILTLAGASGPATAAGPPDAGITTATHPAPAAMYSRQDKSLTPVSSPTTDAGAMATKALAPQAVVRVQVPQGGFDWGDAGIGAAGGVAIAMLGVGGALVVSQRRPDRDRHASSLS